MLQGCSWPKANHIKSGFEQSMLTDDGGALINQISGMTHFSDLILFIAQKENRLFYTEVRNALGALERGEKLRLKSISLEGAFPSEASWEAITVAEIDGVSRLFLSYEHLGDDSTKIGNFHKIYVANLGLRKRILHVSEVKEFSDALPVNNNKAIPVEDQTNFGYEAIEWIEQNRQLVLLPELNGLDSITLDEYGEIHHFSKIKHEFRISDMASSNGDQCLIVSSFCYKSDPVCKKSNKQSKLTLAQLRLNNNAMQIGKTVDISTAVIDMETLDGLGMDTFNAEGISIIGDDILLVNDNEPSKGVGSMLRKIKLPRNLQELCKI